MYTWCCSALSAVFCQSNLQNQSTGAPLPTLAHIDYAIFVWIVALAQLEDSTNLVPTYKKVWAGLVVS